MLLLFAIALASGCKRLKTAFCAIKVSNACTAENGGVSKMAFFCCIGGGGEIFGGGDGDG